MDPASILFTVGQFVPAILRWIGKDNAAAVAGQAVDAARRITGHDEAADALAAIKANPEQLVKYQETLNAVLIAQLDAETRQLEAVNATMRSEIASDDPFVRRARPMFLYAMALTWTVQALGMLAVILMRPELAGQVIEAAAQLTTMWGIALTVVGVAVKARSDDKARELGIDAPSLATSIAGMFARKPPAGIAQQAAAPIIERSTNAQ